jgi:hypothetical protein
MQSIELKSSIHKIIDGIQNEQLLLTLYDFLKTRSNTKSGSIWNSLSENQKNEVLTAFDESEDEYNLMDRDELFKAD